MQQRTKFNVYPNRVSQARSVLTRNFRFVFAGVLCGAVLVLALLIPLLLLRRHDVNLERRVSRIESGITEVALTTLITAILEGESASSALQGFVYNDIRVIPNLTAPPAERLRDQVFPRFDQVGSLISSLATNVVYVLLAPGGVFLRSFPYVAEQVGRDMLLQTDPLFAHHPRPIETLTSGQTSFIGPLYSSVPELEGVWTVDIRRPVYNVTDVADANLDNCWGFVSVAVSISRIMEEEQMDAKMKAAKMNYLLYTLKSDGSVDVIAGSHKEITESEVAQRAFLQTAHTSSLVASSVNLFLSVRSQERVRWLNDVSIVSITFSALAAALLLLLAASIFIVFHFRSYDGRAHAPKYPPFAMLTIGPFDAENLWNTAADAMTAMLVKVEGVLAKAMAAHHAYHITPIVPYTACYTLRSLEAAVEMAFSVIEELQAHPIDDILRQQLHDDRARMQVLCAVHWCTDAEVCVDAVTNDFTYSGPDVMYGARMWMFSVPNTVTVSAAAESRVRDMPHLEVHVIDAVRVRGMEAAQNVYHVTDPKRKLLADAIAAAQAASRNKERVCRAVPALFPTASDARPLLEGGENRDGEFTTGSSPTDRTMEFVWASTPTTTVNAATTAAVAPVAVTSAVSPSALALQLLPPPSVVLRSPRGNDGGGGDHSESVTCSVTMRESGSNDATAGKAANGVDRGRASAGVAMRLQVGTASGARRRPHRPRLATGLFETGSDENTSSVHEGGSGGSTSSSWSDGGDGRGSGGGEYRSRRDARNDDERTCDASTSAWLVTSVASASGPSLPFGATATSATAGSAVCHPLLRRVQRKASQPMICLTDDADEVARWLLRPRIPTWLDAELRAAFVRQAVALDTDYDDIRVLVYYYLVGFKLLFRPLATAERENIFRRFVTAFGVPRTNILDHLAVNCAVQSALRQEDAGWWWLQQLQASSQTAQ